MCVCGGGGLNSYQAFAGEHLQQFDEHASISQVQVEVGDAAADPRQDGVDPFGEGLLLNRLTLIWRLERRAAAS